MAEAEVEMDAEGPETHDAFEGFDTKDAAPSKAATKPLSSLFELPWYLECRAQLTHVYRVEKYRPLELKDIVGNEETVSRLQVPTPVRGCRGSVPGHCEGREHAAPDHLGIH